MSPRLLVAKISFVSNSFASFSLGSIYMPAQSGERKQYINVLKQYPEISMDIFAGDCNVIANPALDHSLGNRTVADRDWPDFRKVMQTWSLTDLLRAQDGQLKQFTHWQNTENEVTVTRIDYMFTSTAWVLMFSALEVHHCPYSDHKYLLTSMRLGETIYGKSYWKFNIFLTNNEDFVSAVKDL